MTRTTIPDLVRDFGGVGDDSTLNDAAIAAWISAGLQCGAATAGPGIFRSTNGIYIGAGFLHLTGAGYGATQFRVVNNAVTDAIAAVGASGQGNALIIEDIGLAAPVRSVPGSSGIAIINNSRAIIRRCRIDGSHGGFWITNSFATIIEECYLTNMVGAVLSYNSDLSANGSSFNRNSLFNNGHATGAWAINVPNCAGVWTANENDIEGNAGGFALGTYPGFKPLINGNWSERNGPSGIMTNPQGYSGPAYTGVNFGF